MKKIIAAILILYSVSIFAQNNIDIIDYRIDNYPEIEVDLLLFDESGNILSAIPHTNFVVRDNGNILNTTDFSCPEQNVSDPSSIILTLDLALKSDDNRQYFDLGKDLLSGIIDELDPNNTEISLNCFDHLNYLLSDFTYNKADIINTLSNVDRSKTSFIEAAFIDKPAGAFLLADQNQTKDMILVTDSKSSFDMELLSTGLESRGLRLHCLYIGGEIPNDLKSLIENSGGFWIDNIDNNSDVYLQVNSLLRRIEGHKPCTLKWSGEITCNDEHFIQISVPSLSVSESFTFEFEADDKPYIESQPEYLGFSSVEIGTSKELDITLIARNADIYVQELTIDDPRFQITTSPIADFTINENNFHNLSIEYTPTDSAIVFSEIVIRSNACDGERIPITGGYPNTPPVSKTIDLISPVCDEVLIVGEQEKIEWVGLLPSDVTLLEFTANNGISWDTLAKNYTGLELDWTVPDIPSDECLIKITQYWPNYVGRTLDLHHNGEVNSAFFNGDGSKVLTASSDNTVVLWNSNTGAKINTFEGHKKGVNYAVFSPNEKTIASASDDNLVIIWNADTGEKIAELTGHNNRVLSVNYSHNGQLIVTASRDGTTKLWRTSNYTEVMTLNSNISGITEYAEFSPDDSRVITCGYDDGMVKLWDWQNQQVEKTFNTKGENDFIGHVVHATFNHDGSKIAASNIINEKVSVWDVATGDTLYCVTHSLDTSAVKINSTSFHYNPNDGEILLTSGISDYKARWWNGETGEPVFPFKLSEHSNAVATAVFNFDASRVLTASWDSTAKVWNRDQNFLQIDTTACPFSIAYAGAKSSDIDFGEVIVDKYKDSIVTQYIINEVGFDFVVQDVRISGTNENDFLIVTDNFSPFVLDSADSVEIELRFAPSDIGVRTANIEILIPGDTLSYELFGIGINPGLVAASDLIEFGDVELGDLKQQAFDIMVTNKGSEMINIDSIYLDGPYKEEFAIQAGNSFTSVAPNQSLSASLRFTPSSLGTKNAQLIYKHDGVSTPTKINLLGTGIENVLDSLSLVVSETIGSPGDIVEIPILIKNPTPEALLEYAGLRTTIRYNATILEPLEFESISDEIVNNERIMKLELPFDQMEGEVIETLKFRVALGNDSVSYIIPEFTELIGNNKIVIDEQFGKVSVSGLCEDGGLRLFHTEGELLLEQNTPNPAINQTTVKFEIIETGVTKLFVTDINGNIVKEILSADLSAGSYQYEIETGDLPQGSYFYILQTPTQRITRKMLIKK